MPEDAVIDSPELDTSTVDDSTAVDTSTAEPDAGSEPTEPAEGADATPGAAPTQLSGPAVIDGKKLSDTAKRTLDEIKTKDPQLASQLRRALFDNDAFRREVPGGLKEVRGMRAQLEELGGFDGISERGHQLEYFHQLDQQFTAGDPKFVEAMTETPEGQQALQQLMPSILGKFKSLNEEGHSAYVAKEFIAQMQEAGIPNVLDRLLDFLPNDQPRVTQLWQALSGFFNNLHGLSKKAIAPAAAPTGDKRNTELDQREAHVTQQEWQNARNQERTRVFSGEWTRLTAGRKLTPTQTQAVKELYAARMNRVMADPKYRGMVDRYFQNRDKTGYLRHQASVLKQEIPRQLRAAFDAIVPTKPGPKPGQAAAPGAGRPAGKPGQPASGFTWLAKTPAKGDIDFRRTSPDMIRQGKAVLNDGKRVQWRAA